MLEVFIHFKNGGAKSIRIPKCEHYVQYNDTDKELILTLKEHGITCRDVAVFNKKQILYYTIQKIDE